MRILLEPPPPPAPPAGIRIFCQSCGCHNVMRDAWAEWDETKQRWTLGTVFDEGFCQNCDGSAKLDDVPLATVYNQTLYNCCRGMFEPDWTQFDGIEIQCCRDDDGATESCDLEEADFFTVYGHLKDGGVDAITDVSTRKLAHTIAALFLPKIDSKHGIHDYCHEGK